MIPLCRSIFDRNLALRVEALEALGRSNRDRPDVTIGTRLAVDHDFELSAALLVHGGSRAHRLAPLFADELLTCAGEAALRTCT
jgi:hypothetical protein